MQVGSKIDTSIFFNHSSEPFRGRCARTQARPDNRNPLDGAVVVVVDEVYMVLDAAAAGHTVLRS